MKNIPSPRKPDNKRAWREHARLIWAITAKDLLEVVKNKSTISVLISALFILVLYRMLPTLTTRMEPPGVLVYDAGDSALVAFLVSKGMMYQGFQDIPGHAAGNTLVLRACHTPVDDLAFTLVVS